MLIHIGIHFAGDSAEAIEFINHVSDLLADHDQVVGIDLGITPPEAPSITD